MIKSFRILTSFSLGLGLLTDVGRLPGSYFSIHLGSRGIIQSQWDCSFHFILAKVQTEGPQAHLLLVNTTGIDLRLYLGLSQINYSCCFYYFLCLNPKWSVSQNQNKPPPQKNMLIYWINTSIKFSKEFFSQDKFHPPKSPTELIETRNQLWYLLEGLSQVIKIFSKEVLHLTQDPKRIARKQLY